MYDNVKRLREIQKVSDRQLERQQTYINISILHDVMMSITTENQSYGLKQRIEDVQYILR